MKKESVLRRLSGFFRIKTINILKPLKIRREIRLGALFVLSLLLFVWGINFLKGKDVFARQVVFYAVYDNVGGLLETNPVSVSGVNIGQVHGITFHPDGSGQVIVKAMIDRQISIPVNSEAVIAATDIFGFKGLRINLGDAARHINSGDTLTGLFQASAGDVLSDEFENIKNQAAVIVAKVDAALTGINNVLSAANIEKIDHTIESFKQTMSLLQKTTHRIDGSIEQELDKLSNIMTGIESVTENIKSHNETIDHIITNISDFSDILVAEEFLSVINDAAVAMQSIRNILHAIEEGKGTAGLLLSDEMLYHKLTESSEQIELLLEDIRENPGRYFRVSVFGR